MKDLDLLDQEIIKNIRLDSFTSKTQLAKKLNVNEGTIRKRIGKLVQSSTLRIKGVVNPEKIPHKNLILIGVNVSITSELVNVAQKISYLPNVNSVMITAGMFDIFIELFINPDEFATFLMKYLSKIKNIKSTNSFISLVNINKWI